MAARVFVFGRWVAAATRMAMSREGIMIPHSVETKTGVAEIAIECECRGHTPQLHDQKADVIDEAHAARAEAPSPHCFSVSFLGDPFNPEPLTLSFEARCGLERESQWLEIEWITQETHTE